MSEFSFDWATEKDAEKIYSEDKILKATGVKPNPNSLFVCRHNEEIVGYADFVGGFLTRVFVKPEYGRRGIGKTLCIKAVQSQFIRNPSLKQIWCTAKADERTKQKDIEKFYAQTGFKVLPRSPTDEPFTKSFALTRENALKTTRKKQARTRRPIFLRPRLKPVRG